MHLIPALLQRLRRRLAAEHGIALIYVLLTMVFVFALAGAALAAVTFDTGGTASDTYQKQAYAAAQAGIQRYLFELNANNTYWTQCVPAGTNWLVNTGQTETPQPVPGSSDEQYAVMLLPAAGQNVYSQCSTTDPVDSMIQASGQSAGTLRVASTGDAVSGSGKVMAKRTIVAAFKQQNFIDYAYFTNYETSDPIVQVADAFASTSDQDTAIEPPDQCGTTPNCGGSYHAALYGGTINGTTYPGALKQCTQYRSAGRENQPFAGGTYGSGWYSHSASFYCANIEFINNDQINGPFHSNDSIMICGSPTFGRSGNNDVVEFGGDKTVYPKGWFEAQGCSGSPTVNGTLTSQDTNLAMPKVNSLSNVASTTLTGTTCLTFLSTGTIQVAHPSSTQTCASSGLTTTTMNYPGNGVLYVAGTACPAYDPDQPNYTGNSACGTVYVKGTVTQPLTIGADNDIVINGNLTYPSPNTTGAMLGLVATNFIRVYHPVSGGVCTSSGASNASGSLTNLTIDAMMLSLNHSFIVDDYSCGSNLGTLTVDGGIAQNFRGAVGQGYAGYTKNYIYDSRLEYEEPPHFLAPANGAYAIAHQTECDVAASCDGTS